MPLPIAIVRMVRIGVGWLRFRGDPELLMFRVQYQANRFARSLGNTRVLSNEAHRFELASRPGCGSKGALCRCEATHIGERNHV